MITAVGGLEALEELWHPHVCFDFPESPKKTLTLDLKLLIRKSSTATLNPEIATCQANHATPLHVAAVLGHVDVAQLLLEDTRRVRNSVAFWFVCFFFRYFPGF